MMRTIRRGLVLLAIVLSMSSADWEMRRERIACSQASCCSAAVAMDHCALSSEGLGESLSHTEAPLQTRRRRRRRSGVRRRRRRIAKATFYTGNDGHCGIAAEDNAAMAKGGKGQCAAWDRMFSGAKSRFTFVVYLRRIAFVGNLMTPLFLAKKALGADAACCKTLVPDATKADDKWTWGKPWSADMVAQCCGKSPGSICDERNLNTCRPLEEATDRTKPSIAVDKTQKMCRSYMSDAKLSKDRELGEDIALQDKFLFSSLKKVAKKVIETVKDKAKSVVKSGASALVKLALKKFSAFLPKDYEGLFRDISLYLLDYKHDPGAESMLQKRASFIKGVFGRMSPGLERLMRDKMGMSWVALDCWMKETLGLMANPDYYLTVDPLHYRLPRSKELRVVSKLFTADYGSYELSKDEIASAVDDIEVESNCADVDGRIMKGCDTCGGVSQAEALSEAETTKEEVSPRAKGPMAMRFRLWPRDDDTEKQRKVKEPTCEFKAIFDFFYCREFVNGPKSGNYLKQENLSFSSWAFKTKPVNGCLGGAWTHRVAKTMLTKDNGEDGVCQRYYTVSSSILQAAWGVWTSAFGSAIFNKCYAAMGSQ